MVIFRSLEGINAAVVGIMAGATFYLMKDTFLIALFEGRYIAFLDILIIALTFFLLQLKRIPAPLIVLGCLVLGYLVH